MHSIELMSRLKQLLRTAEEAHMPNTDTVTLLRTIKESIHETVNYLFSEYSTNMESSLREQVESAIEFERDETEKAKGDRDDYHDALDAALAGMRTLELRIDALHKTREVLVHENRRLTLALESKTPSNISGDTIFDNHAKLAEGVDRERER